MDVRPLGGAGHGDGHSLSGKHLAVKLALHGEAGTDQADALHSRHRHRIPGSLHDADEGDRRAGLHSIEDEVRRVRRDERDLRPGAGEAIKLAH